MKKAQSIFNIILEGQIFIFPRNAHDQWIGRKKLSKLFWTKFKIAEIQNN